MKERDKREAGGEDEGLGDTVTKLTLPGDESCAVNNTDLTLQLPLSPHTNPAATNILPVQL